MEGHGTPDIDPRVESARRWSEVYDNPVNRNLVDTSPPPNGSRHSGTDSRPEGKKPHDESPEYGRWVHGIEGDGYDVGEVEEGKADFEEVMRVFGDFMADDVEEGDEPYRADGGYDTAIPVGGQPSFVEPRQVEEEDKAYMGDFPV